MTKTIFEVLREDHDKQRTLLDLVDKTHGDSEGRRELFERLRIEATAHAAVEERVFYSELLADERTRGKAGHSVKEHKDAEDIFEELANMDMSSPGWLTRFRTLKEELLHHVEEEEHEVFQMAGKVLTESQQRQMAQDFTKQKPGQKEEEAA